MKQSFLLLFLFLLFASSTKAQKKGSKRESKQMLYHLNILDSAAKQYGSDTIPCCSQSIAFMVENTNVPVKAQGTFHGFLFFTKEDLSKWHSWYNKSYGRSKQRK